MEFKWSRCGVNEVQLEWMWTGCGLDVDWMWTGCGVSGVQVEFKWGCGGV